MPRSIFARVFWAALLLLVIPLAIIWGWFYSRVYTTLNVEAENRLVNMTQVLAAELEISRSKEIAMFRARAEVLKRLWHYERAGSWIQNLYWLDVSEASPRFIASFSVVDKERATLLPPTAREAEDMVFSCINELESGQVVMPDPFAFGPSRRFKIALFPILDEDSMLESVIGIEADMKYLQLTDQLNNFFFEIFVMSFLACLLTAYVFARGLSAKLRILTNSLKEIEKKNIPEIRDLQIEELNVLYNGMIDLAKEIRRKDVHLQQLFSRKLEELAFTGGAIAHEIRNPLSAIEMHFGLLKRKLQKNNESQNESLTEITQQLGILRNLINNFLCYSRQVKPQKELINLHDAIKEFADSRRLVNKNLVCHLNISEEIEICFDRAMLQQICENLLNNAADAAPEKDVNVVIACEISDGICRLSFTNDGPAIPEQIYHRLFTPFVSEKSEGNGIGLALVRKLTEAHNGDIYCQNKPAKVSFVLEVPCR